MYTGLAMFHKVDRESHLVSTTSWLIYQSSLITKKNPTKKYWIGFGQMSSFITSPNSSPASCSVNQQKKLCGSWWPRFLPFNMFCWLYRWVRSCIETLTNKINNTMKTTDAIQCGKISFPFLCSGWKTVLRKIQN